MKVNYKDDLNGVFKHFPNGAMHLFLILILPLYIMIGMFKGGIVDALKEWWGEFYAKWVFSVAYKKKKDQP